MKILLIHPVVRSRLSKIKMIKAYIPPLTLPTLAGLTPREIDVEICDESVDEVNPHTDANLIGITGITSQINRGYELADMFRKKGKTVIMGGIHVSALPAEAKLHCDSVIIGEAEDIWEVILEDFQNDNLKEEYKANRYSDLKKLVIPRYDLLKLDRYRKSTGTNIPRLPIQTTRGCPFNCNFCSVTRFWGPKIRTKPLENVEKELFHIRGMGTNRVFFTDDNFIANPSYTRELIKLIKKYNFTFFCQVSSNIQQHEDIICAMGDAGCTGVFIGVESFSDSNLLDINKKFNKQADYKKLFALFAKAKIQVTAGLMMGLDDDTKETMNDTIKRLYELNVSHVQLNLLMLLPGTKLKEKYERENKITDTNWDNQNGTMVTFKPKHFDADELQNYYWQLYKYFYSLPRIFKRILTRKNYSLGVRILLIQLNTNLYFRKRLQYKLHPYGN